MKRFYKNSIVIVLVFCFVFVALSLNRPATAFSSPTPIALATSGHFAILAGSAVTGTGVDAVTGDVGLDPTGGAAITLLTCAEMTGASKIYDNDAGYTGGGVLDVSCLVTDAGGLSTAKADLALAYTDAVSIVSHPVDSTIATDLGGQILTTGVYDSASGTFSNSGTLTLDAENNPNNVFIFKMGTTLITSSSSHVVLINGAKASNVFWAVGSSATLGSSSDLMGTIMAQASITLNTSATVHGRLLADADNNIAGAVTLDGSNTVILDTTAPTVAITDDELGIANIAGGTITYNFTFSEPVSGFTVGDVAVVGGTKAGAFASGADGSSVYTLVVTPSANFEGNLTVDVAGNVAVDPSGNGNTLAPQSVQVVDTLAPTVLSISFDDSNIIIGETPTVTIVMSEPVALFTNADVTTPNGTLGVLATGDNITFTGTFTPNAIEDNTNLAVVATTFTDTAGNPASAGATSANYAIETIAPTVISISFDDSNIIIGDTPTVTIVMSEPVASFDNTDVTTPNGTLGALSTGDNITFTGTFTPNAIEDPTNIASVATTFTDTAGNPASAGASSANYAIETIAPTVISISFDDSNIIIGDTPTVTIVMSEPVALFTNADVTTPNGTLGALSTGDNITFTGTFTPNAIEDNTNLAVVATTFTDTAGNPASAGATSANYAIDTIAPTVISISFDDSNIIIGDTPTVTIVMSEPVASFDNTDVTTPNGTLGALSTGDNITFTGTFTPNAIEDNTNLAVVATTFTDTAGNPASAGATSANYAIDTIAPTVISISFDDSNIIIGDTPTVTIVMSEPVASFDNTDVTTPNGTLGALSTGDNITFTGTFTPNAIEDPTNIASVATTFTDTAGNPASAGASSANYAIDTIAPTVISISFDDSNIIIGDTPTVTIVMSEPVALFTNADVTTPNGTLGVLATGDNITFTGTFTPNAIEDNTNLAVVATTFTDTAGNPASAGATSANYAIETIAPTVISISFSDSNIIIGETPTVTIVMSEPVALFTNADVTTPNGTLGALSTGDNITFTGTFTPNAIEDNTNLAVVATTFTDTAGNPASAGATSANYAIETIAPTVISISFDDSNIIIGDTPTVTIVMSEPVASFTNADVTTPNGTLGALSTGDNITFTGTFTPNAIEDNTNLAVVATTFTDTAGNPASAGATSANYAIDTIAPTVISISFDDSNIIIGDTPTVTIVMSEPVASFDNTDVTTPNGTLGALSTGDNITFTGTFTPNAIEDNTNLAVVATTFTDTAGNPASAGASSANYAIETIAPTVLSISFDDSNIIIGDTPTVTIVMSEPVALFTNADVTTPNGTLGALSTGDNITFTGTFTPNAIEDNTNLAVVATTFTDTAGNPASAGATSANYAIDTIAPTVISATTSDNNANGKIDRITVVYSKAVVDGDYNAFSTAGYSMPGTGSGTGATTLIYNLTEIGAFDTGAIPVLTWTDANAQDLAGNLLDSSGAPAVTDGAAPVIVSTLPVSAAINVAKTANVVVTFSEPMTTGSVTKTSVPDPLGWIPVWTVGDTVATYSHTVFANSTLYTFAITAGDSAAIGDGGLTAGPVPNPFSFTTVAASGGGGGSQIGVPTGTIVITGDLIDSGADTTTSREVTISSTYSSNAAQMIISEDPNFIGATYQPVALTVPFTLSADYGVKTVYVMFRSNSGISQVYSDTITYSLVAAPEDLTPVLTLTYGATEALAASPTINIDKTLTTPPAGTFLACVSGTLIKLPSDNNLMTQIDSSVYYCGADGKRYVFPDAGTYYSWYSDFSGITIISAAQLAAIPLGGNVTYRPGRFMLKVQSDSKVYAIDKGGVLRWVENEAVAQALYGPLWSSLIKDISDAFFVNYVVGAPITLAGVTPAVPAQ